MVADEDRDFAKTLTVLCVEDDLDTLTAMARALGRRFRRVIEAADGEEGLARFRAEQPDVVITDVQMPRMDGLAMASAIRREAPRVPIVVSSAFEDVSYLRRAIDAGVDRYVTKPVSVAQLDATLVEVARRVRAERALERQRQAEIDELRARSIEGLALLVGGVAHDVNNIVQSVLSSLEVALGLAPPEGELHDVLEEGLESTRSAAQLGAALRTLSNETVFLSPGDVVPVVERALLAATAGTRLSLRIELPREPIVVEMDAHLVRRLFSELARSAISATTRPGVLRVRARVRRTSEGELLGLPSGGSVEIDVHDDGPGLPPELVPRIFDPYVGLKERVANRGVGLGLAACAAIAKKHRGHLSVDASPEGTTFRLVLPLAQAHRHE